MGLEFQLSLLLLDQVFQNLFFVVCQVFAWHQHSHMVWHSVQIFNIASEDGSIGGRSRSVLMLGLGPSLASIEEGLFHRLCLSSQDVCVELVVGYSLEVVGRWDAWDLDLIILANDLVQAGVDEPEFTHVLRLFHA